ncbi:MAG: type VI secretion system-associated protein [Roseobacter sp. MedPE-SW]|nr:MAG: type VI secretion system-associated protein [Roseobacter sp. MedPE-SW]
MADSSQKFIGRNRAPRVQIEYDVELYGAEKKVQLPFVMGVMSDLVGKSNSPQPAIGDRKFLEIDVDNFDKRMKSMAPRAAFTVPNTLTGEGNLAIDLTFESMKDFSPGAIASKVDSLRPLLEARTQLQTLMAYMDGKSGAEDLIEKILHNPALLSTLAQGNAASAADQESALDSLRGVALPEAEQDQSDDVLAELAARAPTEAEHDDGVEGALAALTATAPEDDPNQEDAQTDAALAALAAAAPEEAALTEDMGEEALASLRAVAPDTEDIPEDSADILGDLARAGEDLLPSEVPSNDGILDNLAAQELPESDAPDPLADILSDLEASAPTPQEDGDNLSDVLGALQELTLPAVESETVQEASKAILDGLATQKVAPDPEDNDLSALLDELSAAAPAEEDSEEADLSDILGALDEGAQEEQSEDQVDDILTDVLSTAPGEPEDAPEEDPLEDILGELDLDDGSDTAEDDVDLEGLLGELSTAEQDNADSSATLDEVLAGLDVPEDQLEPDSSSDLEDVLSDLATDGEEDSGQSEGDLSLEGLLSDLDLDQDAAGDTVDVDSILSDLEITDEAESRDDSEASLTELLGATDAAEADLDDLLGDLTSDPAEETEQEAPSPTAAADESDGLDDLLADLDSEEAADPAAAETALDLSDDLSDLEALLGDLESDAPQTGVEEVAEPQSAAPDAERQATTAEPEFAYGTISAERPEAEQLTRKRFRIALFGDFSGRAARGQVETGAALAQRQGILLDPDTVEEIIEGFASELVLPIGQDEGGIAIKLKEFDDLHPDELFENVALFSELVSLRDQLQSGVTVDHASRSLAAWAAQYGTPVRVPKRSSPSNSIPADRRLSAFQQLIGDTEGSMREASPIDEMLARVVGPYIRALPNPEVPAMQAAVDAALSDAMRLVLHHPEFQALEAQWRSLDLIARSVEVDDSLEVVLYDVSAEELAADLAAQDDLSGSGFTRLLSEEPMDPELGRGGYSALIGMYGFEETPPHAELLGRIARVAAHVDAPFFTSLSPDFLKTAKKDRPALVANAWDTLQQMPEAGHLALASPRFLLRRPYGAKSNPVDAFDFEEFSEVEGLKGMLWGNPVVLVTILLARSFKENGASMQLGSIMSLGGMPYHTVNDRFGDQVALPCTERNIDLDKIAMANERGVMALSAVKGRDELRLTSFSSVAGGEVLGPWSGVPTPAPSPADPREKTGIAAAKPAEPAMEPDTEADDLDLSDLGLDDLDLGGEDTDDATSDEADLDDLDALLAGFGEETDTEEDDDEMDAELAALLADL